jgi:multiple sugar transport system ATP-binding protein
MRAEISTLQKRLKTTTVYVTHDQIEAMTMGDRIAVMSKGLLQQAGTPEELYTRPRNLFVAGFIGSPAMNLVPVEPVTGDGQAMLRRGGFVVRVPEKFMSNATAQGTRELVVGLRPEHLLVANGTSPEGTATVPAVVDVVEYLGDEQLVHLHAGDVELVAKVPVEPRLKSGQAVELAVPLEKLYLFDQQTESALTVTA